LLKRLVLAGSILAVMTAGLAFYLIRFRAPIPAPPEFDFDEMEPAVAELVGSARQRVVEDPRSAESWGTLGEILLANDMEKPSVECFAQAERLDGGSLLWPYYQAVAWYNQGNLEQAVVCLRRAIPLCSEPEAGTPRLLLGEILLKQGRADDAAELFRKVLLQRPADARAHFDLGLVAISRQDWKSAREEFHHCLGHPATRQKASIQLALVCRRLGDVQAANGFQQQARRLPKDAGWPDPLIVYHLRWTVLQSRRLEKIHSLMAAHRFPEALGEVQQLTAQYPDDYRSLATLGELLGRMGDHAGSEAALRKALSLAPDKPSIHHHLSLALLQQGEALFKDGSQARANAYFEEAIRHARETLAQRPDFGMAHLVLGQAYRRLGRTADAIAALRQAVRCSPESAEVHFFLGEVLAEAGQKAEARSRLEHALRLAEPGTEWLPAARARLKEIEGKEG
jgi:tetratricopeptide (TPR) repeat protein